VEAALKVNALFFIGVAAVPALSWASKSTGLGLKARMVGDNAEAAAS
jgi:ABC-type uncharacterized transport system permease subunit